MNLSMDHAWLVSNLASRFQELQNSEKTMLHEIAQEIENEVYRPKARVAEEVIFQYRNSNDNQAKG